MLTTPAQLTPWLDGSRGIVEPASGRQADAGARFLGLLVESRLIRRHAELLDWLRQAREYLPHQMLIVAWGDFDRWNLKREVISHLAAQRATAPRGCSLDDLLRDAYAQWRRGGREPLAMGAAVALGGPCGCALHGALRGMRAVLVHGMRDKLSGCDSLYIALDASGAPPQGDRRRFIALAHLLLCQLDIVWRRFAAFQLDSLPVAGAIGLPRELSPREREILANLSRGSTNHDIAEALAISLFTVKNHMKRIFRKIGVSNRTQAAARFNEALMQSAAMQSANHAGQ